MFTPILSSVKKLFGTGRNVSSRQPRARRQLQVETLEERQLLSSVIGHMKDKPIFEIMPNAGSGIAGYSPAQIRQAYGVNGISFNGTAGTGSGQTIAIVDAYNDPNILKDLNQFDQHFGLYQQYGASSTFLAVYNQNGQRINPASTTVPVDSTGGWEGEEALDVEWAHAMAPGAKIDLIECSSNSNGNLYAGVTHAAKLPSVSVVSMSWGMPEFQGENSLDKSFLTPSGHQGVTFLASTGDASQGEYPAFSPNVIAVGGTTLSLSGGETAWSTGSDSWRLTNGTGGGTSQYETEPGFQGGFQNTGMRTTPDVSFEADPATGVTIYDSYKSSSPWQEIGGTSLACPAWAGLFAIANQGRALAGEATFNSSSPSEALQALYSASGSDFNDITSGSISANGTTYYAGAGYDEVTGRGTPVANLLLPELAGGTQPNPTTPPAAPVFTATAVSTTEIDLSWSSVAGASGYIVDEWDSVNSAWVKIGTLGSTATGCSVTGLSPNTTYYLDVAAYNSAGTTWAANYQSATTLSASITIDHPGAGASYTVATGSLFGSGGPHYWDVEQGAEGDCWLLASLAEVAARIPADIQNMFTYKGTAVENGVTVGLYNVRLFDSSGTAHYMTVDTELPAGGGLYDHPANGVLWVALAEKAYAEANGQGFVTTQNPGVDSYDALNEGMPEWALQAITGKQAGDFAFNPNNIAAAWNAGELIVLGSSSSAASPYIIGDANGTHAYAVVGYNPTSTMPFEVYNPWGTNSSGWALGTYNGHQVYGLFWASGAFLAQNFASEDLGLGAANATTGQGQDMRRAADLFFAMGNADATPDMVHGAANQEMSPELVDSVLAADGLRI